MPNISQQIACLVNHMPLIASPLLDMLEDLQLAIKQGPQGPSGFAQAEATLGEHLTRLGLAAELQLLSAQAPCSEIIEYQGQLWRRLDPTNLSVLTPRGRGRVERSLYRQQGVHNGPTIDPVEINAGLLAGMTPGAARLVGALQAATTSRDAAALMQLMHVKISRSAIERGSARVAEQFEAHSEFLEEDLIKDFEIPDETSAIALSVDRVNLPYEVPVKRPAHRPRKGAAKRPCKVIYEQVYCACWTLCDAEGEPLYSCRYAVEPGEESQSTIEDQLRADLLVLLDKRPDLKVVTLSDGAAEMLQMLERVVEGVEVAICLVDFWHLFSYIVAALVALGKDVKREKKRIRRSLLTADSGARKTLMKLRTWKSEYDGEVPEEVEAAITYLSNRLKEGKVSYAAAREANLPVGSGHVEATCKMVVAVRMKRSGSRWKRISAQHVLTLRSLFTSSRYEQAHTWLVNQRQADLSPIRDAA